MDTVDRIGRDIDRTLKTECDVCSVNIVVDRLWQMDHMKSFFAEKIGCLLCAVSTQNDKAVQVQFVIGLFHCFYFIQTVFIRYTHLFERLSG